MALRATAALAALLLALAGGAAAQGMGKAPKAEYGSSAAFGRDGTLFVVTKQDQHVLLQRSGDVGRTWSAPSVVNAAPEAISADGENRPKLLVLADGALLVTWTQPLPTPYSGAIRAARSDDGGASFAAPVTVHHDRAEITHRFETPMVDAAGRIHVAWIDKRDLEAAKAANQPYRGAAIYAAVSEDGGRSFKPETKVADHSCECCRIAGAIDADGSPLLLWRHVFEPNERDHALAKLGADGAPESFQRATFDRWKVDGCPHHGPSLAVAADGTRHAVWFNMVAGRGQASYGRLAQGPQGLRVEGQRALGGDRASHADLAVAGRRVGVVWKEFDGDKTRLMGEFSDDGGQTFRSVELAATEGISDQARALARGDVLYAFWRTEREGMRLFQLP